jgi:acetyl-CoA C-acetyltransferase
MEISLLAELVAFATLGARMGCTGAVAAPDELRALNAKLACCDAAERAIPIAHAVHGAIGITEEYPLGIHVRRLHEWRSTGAVAGVAARRIGNALLHESGETLQFVRTRLAFA